MSIGDIRGRAFQAGKVACAKALRQERQGVFEVLKLPSSVCRRGMTEGSEGRSCRGRQGPKCQPERLGLCPGGAREPQRAGSRAEAALGHVEDELEV